MIFPEKKKIILTDDNTIAAEVNGKFNLKKVQEI